MGPQAESFCSLEYLWLITVACKFMSDLRKMRICCCSTPAYTNSIALLSVEGNITQITAKPNSLNWQIISIL